MVSIQNPFHIRSKVFEKSAWKTMRSAGFHQANDMASTMENVRTEVLEEVNNVQTNTIDAFATDNQPPTVIPQVHIEWQHQLLKR